MDLRLGDGIQGLRDLREVNLIFADLPSGETKAPFDRSLDLDSFWGAASSALAEDGVVVVMASRFEYAAKVVASAQVPFKYDLIWEKSGVTGFLNAKQRPLRAHEFVLVFGGSLFCPQKLEGASPIHAARRRAHGVNYNPLTKSTTARAGKTDRYPVSVLCCGSVGTTSKERVHPQQKPLPLLRWLVRSYTEPGMLVVDPCAGSASMGRAALVEERRFIGFENDPDIFSRAREVT